MAQTVYFKKNLEFLTNHTLVNQSELSRQLGVSRQAVHNMITREENPRLSTILKISDIYCVKASDLLFVDLEEKYKNKKPKMVQYWDC